MAGVELQGLTKSFGAVKAVKGADISFADGSFTTLLGPSGCGKTTILRMIAGLETPTGGDILVGGARVNDVPIHRRNLGIVFQNYALFPHRTIGQNIAFGLKYRKVSKSDMAQKVRAALDVVRLPGVEDRYPSQLSGGQQQRIALARAIVIEPDVLLLDEPLSALDANLREEMRVELKAIQLRIGVTSVFVTHDQSEALAMSDRIVVMSAGSVEQIGAPEEVYNRPASEFVANFLGASNIVPATVAERRADTLVLEVPDFGRVPVAEARSSVPAGTMKAKLMIRAEKLHLSEGAAPEGKISAPGTVEAVDYQGQLARYFLRVGARQFQVMNLIKGSPIATGASVVVSFDAADCTALPAEA